MCGFNEKPATALGLIDPVLKQTGSPYISCFVKRYVHLQEDYPITSESIARPINSKRGAGPHTNSAKSTNLQAA